jgi:antirestriction protein ArdC
MPITSLIEVIGMTETNGITTSVLQDRTTKARQIVDQAVEELAAELERGQSEALKRYLAFLGRFPRYSAGNTLLIWSQMPEATHVAGFHKWKDLGRQVKKGEKGIVILAPIVRRIATKTVEEEEQLFGFKTAHVFDINQTSGKDLPAFAEVHGKPGEHLTRLHKALKDSGIELRYPSQLGSAVGLSRGGCIEVKQGLSEAEEFAVLVHEWAHEILHHQKGVENISKTILETEVEAVSYIVCKAIGLDTNTASSDYIQLYNGKKETLMQSLERIREASGKILGEVVDGRALRGLSSG